MITHSRKKVNAGEERKKKKKEEQAQNLCIAAHIKLWHVVFKQSAKRGQTNKQKGTKGGKRD